MIFLDQEIDSEMADLIGSAERTSENTFPKEIRHLFAYHVRRILLVSTPYDYFLLEEEGRLSDLFRKVYNQREMGYVPTIIHVMTGGRALRILEKDDVMLDLVVVFNNPSDMDVFSLSGKIKEKRPDLPVVFLANNTPELLRINKYARDHDSIEKIFTWQGDGEIFLSIVQLMEDMKNVERDETDIGSRSILLAEDSIQFYSAYLPVIYEEIWNHTEVIMNDELTHSQRSMRKKRRPKVLLSSTFEESIGLFERYNDRLLCVISDMSLRREGKDDPASGPDLVKIIKGKCKAMPVLIQSSEPVDERIMEKAGVQFLRKDRTTLLQDFRSFIRTQLRLTELIFVSADGGEVARATNMRTFERALWSIPDDVLLKYASESVLSDWLIARTEFELAIEFAAAIDSERTAGKLRERLLESFGEYKRKAHLGAVTSFSRVNFGSHVRFSRIGKGALGGKARGLAFMDKIISKYVDDTRFPGVRIFIPRTVVICTDVFDSFIGQNDLMNVLKQVPSDERLASIFIRADLPAVVLGDLRAFVQNVKNPIAVRSSSLLEDALFQPFAGVYSSRMLTNDSRDIDVRFQNLARAIKYVYASTFFQTARSYIHSTPNRIEDEKMAVIVQEIIGEKHDNRFYPTISGVARSINYYPYGTCKAEDGIVNIALGLGKTIVDGGVSFRFCPKRPKVPLSGTTHELLRQSQTKFYAISVESRKDATHQSEEGCLIKLGLNVAEEDGVLRHTASTYVPASDRLYPGTNRAGARVLNFAPVLKYGAFPLAEIIDLMLKMCEISLGCPVEIEFAVNLDNENGLSAEFALLQVRSMVANDSFLTVDIEGFKKEDIFCSCENVLGNGVIDGISDIICIKPDSFDFSKTTALPSQIRSLNNRLLDDGRPYLLIGPGRWGSSDPWLGIPVVWGDISGVKVIVETPADMRMIDPSEGSHFFQNMTSLRVAYFTLKSNAIPHIDWKWLNSLRIVEETEFVMHIRSDEPIEVLIDGRKRTGVILKKSSKGTSI